MATRSPTALRLAGGLMLAAALVLAAVPAAHAGAVFEIRENIPLKDALLKFKFTDKQDLGDLGFILRSGTEGAGQFFNTSAIPLAIFTLNKCVAVAPHLHPNGAETVFALKGKLRVHQVRGEQDGNTLRSVDISAGEAAYIQQGSVHLVENIGSGTSAFLQLFDHPQAGAVFAANTLVALPNNIVNSAFSEKVLPKDVTALSPFIKIRGCKY